MRACSYDTLGAAGAGWGGTGAGAGASFCPDAASLESWHGSFYTTNIRGKIDPEENLVCLVHMR